MGNETSVLWRSLAQYSEWLIKPVGTIDRQLIDEWPNIEPIIRALGLKEISQSILIKKLCTYPTSNRTRKAIFEYDKLIRSIYTFRWSTLVGKGAKATCPPQSNQP